MYQNLWRGRGEEGKISKEESRDEGREEKKEKIYILTPTKWPARRSLGEDGRGDILQ
jgi:hypothetical protein